MFCMRRNAIKVPALPNFPTSHSRAVVVLLQHFAARARARGFPIFIVHNRPKEKRGVRLTPVTVFDILAPRTTMDGGAR